MKTKLIVGAVAAVILAAGALYFASPFMAMNALHKAAREGDRAKLERMVDFPAVRASMKSQLNAVMTRAMGDDPALKDNPFAALGVMLLGAVVDRAVDLYATPDGVAQMIETAATPQEPGAAVAPAPATEPAQKPSAKDSDSVETDYHYASLNQFRIETRNRESPEVEIAFILERRGLFGWKMVDIRLPTEAMRKSIAQEPGDASAAAR